MKALRRTLHRVGETTPEIEAKLAAARYTEEQILGDWFPDEPV